MAAVEIYGTEVHDPDAEMQAFLADCEECYRRDHEVAPSESVIADVSYIPGPGPLYTVTAKVTAR